MAFDRDPDEEACAICKEEPEGDEGDIKEIAEAAQGLFCAHDAAVNDSWYYENKRGEGWEGFNHKQKLRRVKKFLLARGYDKAKVAGLAKWCKRHMADRARLFAEFDLFFYSKGKNCPQCRKK